MEIVKINPDDYGVEKTQALELTSNLPQILEERKALEAQYAEVIKMDIEDPVTSKKARLLRLLIVKNRTQGINKWHSNAKEYFLRGGQFVDAIKKNEAEVNKRMEDNLTEIEKHFEIKEKKRLEALQEARVLELSKFVEDADERNLSSMDNDVWDAYLSAKKKAFYDDLEAKRLAEEERLNQEKLDKIEQYRINTASKYSRFWENSEYDFRDMCQDEFDGLVDIFKTKEVEEEKKNEAIRLENEKLKAEKEAAEKEVAEKEAAEKLKEEKAVERRRLAAIQYLLDHDFDNAHGGMKLMKFDYFISAEKYSNLQSESEFDSFCSAVFANITSRKAESDLMAKLEADKKAKEEAEAKAQAELNRGDADKVKDLINDLRLLKTKYTFKSDKNKKMFVNVCILIEKIIKFIG